MPSLTYKSGVLSFRRTLVFHLDHSVKRHIRGPDESIAWSEISVDVEASMAGSACMSTRASSDTKRYAVSVAGSANGKVRLQHERIALDEDLIASLNVRIYRFQIEDLIGRSIRARGKNSRVQAAFRVNSST